MDRVLGFYKHVDEDDFMSEQYQNVCRDRFNDVKHDIEKLKEEEIIPLRTDVTYLKAKIDNGLSHLPGRMNWLFGVLVMLLLGVIALAYQSGSNQSETRVLIETHIEQSEDMQERLYQLELEE